jgi:hypothetical protein
MSMSVEPTPESGIEPTTDLEELDPEEEPDAEEYTPPTEVRPDLDGSEADILEQAIEVPELVDDDDLPE